MRLGHRGIWALVTSSSYGAVEMPLAAENANDFAFLVGQRRREQIDDRPPFAMAFDGKLRQQRLAGLDHHVEQPAQARRLPLDRRFAQRVVSLRNPQKRRKDGAGTLQNIVVLRAAAPEHESVWRDGCFAQQLGWRDMAIAPCFPSPKQVEQFFLAGPGREVEAREQAPQRRVGDSKRSHFMPPFQTIAPTRAAPSIQRPAEC